MHEADFELSRNSDTLTTDQATIPVEAALGLLKGTYWAGSLTRESLVRAMDNSLCFAVLRQGTLVAFARVITDRSTFAYLTDVVVAEGLRGQGVGQWLMQGILAHPDLQGLRRFALLTGDAVAYYESFGFTVGGGGMTYMERRGAA